MLPFCSTSTAPQDSLFRWKQALKALIFKGKEGCLRLERIEQTPASCDGRRQVPLATPQTPTPAMSVLQEQPSIRHYD